MEMEWTRGTIIGRGSSATVYLATSSSDVAAVKSAPLSQPQSQQQLQREQRILSSLSSPHIVTYKGCDITKENHKLYYNLFMEYMPFGTLSQANRRLNEAAIAEYTRQILQGLDYLHSNGVVHCDIKGSNILVGEEGVVKIGDFGCAKFAAESPAAMIAGTPMFMAPEAARGEEQGYPCDVWALGCTVVEIATGFVPWPNVEDPVNVLYRVAYSGESPEIPRFLSEQAKDFLGKCFRRNPKERWSCDQLLKHPFLAEFNSFNSDGKQVQESDSPTSILEQRFWNSVEDSYSSEGFFHGNLGQTSSFEHSNSVADRIRELAVCSGDPRWAWNDDDDENWITTRGNETGVSISDGVDLDVELEKTNVSGGISGCFCEDYKFRNVVSIVDDNNCFNFEKGIAEMLLPSTLDFL